MKSEVKWWTFQTLFDFTRKVREEPIQIKNIFLTKSYFIYISGFQTELKEKSSSLPWTWGCRARRRPPRFCRADSGRCWRCPPTPGSRRRMRLIEVMRNQRERMVISYFPEVGFLSAVVSLMCEIFSRLLKLIVKGQFRNEKRKI